jgi:hypothetical protein
MNDVRQKLLSTIVEPAADNRSSSTLTATVTDADEKANTCSISYTRTDGKKMNKDNIPVMLTNKSIIDWFPEKNENVFIQEKTSNIVYITGPANPNYNDIRKENSLVNDIFSDSFVDTIGGFLF